MLNANKTVEFAIFYIPLVYLNWAIFMLNELTYDYKLLFFQLCH